MRFSDTVAHKDDYRLLTSRNGSSSSRVGSTPILNTFLMIVSLPSGLSPAFSMSALRSPSEIPSRPTKACDKSGAELAKYLERAAIRLGCSGRAERAARRASTASRGSSRSVGGARARTREEVAVRPGRFCGIEGSVSRFSLQLDGDHTSVLNFRASSSNSWSTA